MKVIVSSKALANGLNEVDFEINYMECLQYDNGYLYLFVDDITISVSCQATFNRSKIYNQIDVRWNSIKDLINQIEEQPITLNISESKLSITINF